MKTFNSYEDYSKYPVSEKITLATVDCKQRLYGFTLESGSIYSVTTDLFVCGCQQEVTSLEFVTTSGAVTSGKYHYDPVLSKLYIYSTVAFTEESTDTEVIPTYRLFFSNSPLNLSWDLSDQGEQVHWEARIKEAPSFSTSVDSDQTGISVAGNGNLKLNNGDLYFKDFYDLYCFENQEATVYSYHRSLDPSQAKIIYKGTITDKSYSNKEIVFKIKDAIAALDESVPLGLINEITDTININEDVGNYFRRRIYGKVENMQVQSVDLLYNSTLDKEAFLLPNNISTTINSRIVIGQSFTTYLSKDDTLWIDGNSYTIDAIKSDTILFISEDFTKTWSGPCYVVPDVPWYNTNRKFLICGHPLSNVITTITQVIQRDRIVVADSTGFVAGDYINFGDQNLMIRRIVDNKIVMNQSVARPAVGDILSKDILNNVIVYYPDTKKYISLDKNDYTTSETSFGTYLVIDSDAEKNATLEKTMSGNFYCVNGIDIIWSGIPSLFRLTFPANVAGSLYGKYFTLYTDNKAAIFYYAKYYPEDLLTNVNTPEYNIALPSTTLNSTTDVFTCASSPSLSNGYQVSFQATSVPTDLVVGYNYFVRNVSGNTFQVSATIDGAISNFGSNGSGITGIIISEVYPIYLTSDSMTSTQVSVAAELVIFDSLESYYTKNLGSGVVTIYSKSCGDILTGSAGDSSTLIEKLSVGRKSDQSLDLTKVLKSRDFVKCEGDSDTTYVEVFDVFLDSFRIRSSFAQTTGIYNLKYKSIGYVNNDSNVFVTTSAKLDANGDEILTASDLVKDLLIEAGLSYRLNLPSFAKSKTSIPNTLSFMLPASLSDSSPTLKDVIDNVNKTVLGSLVLTNDLDIAYNSIDCERDTQNLPVIKDDDIISWDLKSYSDTYRDIIANYRFSDFELEPNLKYSYTNNYSSKYNSSKNTLEVDLYSYDIEELAQRRLYFNTASRSEISIKADLNLNYLNMNDTVILDISGLPNRFGNTASNKILANVTSVKISGETVELTLNTLGADIFKKSAVITSDTAPSFDDATEDDRLYSSYILNNNGTINNRNDIYSSNAIA
jgi:hypothetical protein